MGNVTFREAVRALVRGFRVAFLGFPETPAAVTPRWGARYWQRALRAGFPWLVAVAVLPIALHELSHTPLWPALAVPSAVAVALSAGIARRYALIGWRVVVTVTAVLAGAGRWLPEPGTHWPIVMLFVLVGLVLVVSIRHDAWIVIWVWMTSAVVLSLGLATGADIPTAVPFIVLGSLAGVLGSLVRQRREALHERDVATEVGEVERARRTILEERARIARDLHDVVAHHMSNVVVQAESAPYRIEDLPDVVAAEFAGISRSARQALTEIRSLLGVLRAEPAANPDGSRGFALAPQPDLGSVGALVDTVRAAGARVALDIQGDLARVGLAASQSGYRIVQEALSNALRHAPGAPVAVRLHADAGTLRVAVTNGASKTAPAPGPPGHGILGMRERATAVGGTLEHGATPEGYAVHATLPSVPPDSGRRPGSPTTGAP